MNKKASKIISVYWFTILIIVAVGVYLMMYIYYSYPLDVREWEAEILVNKIADCISEQGMIRNDLLKDGKFNETFKKDFLKKCNLDFYSSDVEEQCYVEINFFNLTSLNESLFNISAGNPLQKDNYMLQENNKFKKLPQGCKQRFYAVEAENTENQILIEILGVIAKTQKNVKL